MNTQIIVVAHRGFSSIYPENTMLAFDKAVQLKVDFIELDVRETKDGEIVVMHDATLDRTTNGKGKVSDVTREDLSLIDAGSWKGFQNVKVAFLDEVLERMKDRVKILIEIKEASPTKVGRLIEKSGMLQNVIVGSFNLDYIKEIRKVFPSISTTLISSRFPETPDVLLENGIPILDVNYKSWNYEIAKEFFSRGVTLALWTVDDIKKMKELIDNGINLITTNMPNILLDVIKKI
ncbi:hypothetical protein M0P98_02010 [bacterium]|nr:hypothetical protein [bacterium]